MATTNTQTTNDRPDNCQCMPHWTEVACWPCYQAGFQEPNPDAPVDSGGD